MKYACSSKFQGRCQVRHLTLDAARRHCDKLNANDATSNPDYYPAFSSGAYLDYTPVTCEERPGRRDIMIKPETVACPECGSPVGKYCDPTGGGFHDARFDRAKKEKINVLE